VAKQHQIYKTKLNQRTRKKTPIEEKGKKKKTRFESKMEQTWGNIPQSPKILCVGSATNTTPTSKPIHIQHKNEGRTNPRKQKPRKIEDLWRKRELENPMWKGSFKLETPFFFLLFSQSENGRTKGGGRRRSVLSIEHMEKEKNERKKKREVKKGWDLDQREQKKERERQREERDKDWEEPYVQRRYYWAKFITEIVLCFCFCLFLFFKILLLFT